MRKNQKGITLIALVVTIVVLLILAVVSINVVFGDDGIFGTAKQSANQTANAAHYEANILGTELQTFVDEAVNGTGGNGGGTTPENPNPNPNPTPEPEPDPEPTKPTLVSKVSVGDFVNYDAVLTKWSSTVASPTTTGTFGGYTQDTYKGTSINSYNNSYKTTTNGWRVLSVDEATGVVRITTAGAPAQGYYGNSSSDRTAMISAMDTFANSNFVASGYATGAENMKKTDTDSLGSSNDLQNNGSYYWLGTANTANDSGGYYSLYRVHGSSGHVNSNHNNAFGVRPIVSLRSGILTNEAKSTDVHGNTGWDLVLAE